MVFLDWITESRDQLVIAKLNLESMLEIEDGI